MPKKLFWIGSSLFAPALSSCGLEVHEYNFEEAAVFRWQDLVRLAGWKPDVLVVADKSRPPFVLGVESFPCLTVFYGVDSHIHSWFPYYAQAFDLCILSLRDHIEKFRGHRLPDSRIVWSPAFSPDTDFPQPDTQKIWDVLFVGTVSENTPLRRLFLQQLAQRVPNLQIMRGNYRELYPKAKIVLNICERGDLNFRVFEALGMGSCLLTPMIQNGFSDLFQDGVDLLTYPSFESENMEKALDGAVLAIHRLLNDPDLRSRLAANGFAKVNARHRTSHRAQNFKNFIDQIPSDAINKRIHEANFIRKKWLRLFYLLLAQSTKIPLLSQAYLKAAQGKF